VLNQPELVSAIPHVHMLALVFLTSTFSQVRVAVCRDLTGRIQSIIFAGYPQNPCSGVHRPSEIRFKIVQNSLQRLRKNHRCP
jgi:hypothetical protein